MFDWKATTVQSLAEKLAPDSETIQVCFQVSFHTGFVQCRATCRIAWSTFRASGRPDAPLRFRSVSLQKLARASTGTTSISSSLTTRAHHYLASHGSAVAEPSARTQTQRAVLLRSGPGKSNIEKFANHLGKHASTYVCIDTCVRVICSLRGQARRHGTRIPTAAGSTEEGFFDGQAT